MIIFKCDKCNATMEKESDRYYIRGNIAEEQLDLCPKCLNVVRDFIQEQEEQDEYDDDSVRTARKRR